MCVGGGGGEESENGYVHTHKLSQVIHQVTQTRKRDDTSKASLASDQLLPHSCQMHTVANALPVVPTLTLGNTYSKLLICIRTYVHTHNRK